MRVDPRVQESHEGLALRRQLVVEQRNDRSKNRCRGGCPFEAAMLALMKKSDRLSLRGDVGKRTAFWVVQSFILGANFLEVSIDRCFLCGIGMVSKGREIGEMD